MNGKVSSFAEPSHGLVRRIHRMGVGQVRGVASLRVVSRLKFIDPVRCTLQKDDTDANRKELWGKSFQDCCVRDLADVQYLLEQSPLNRRRRNRGCLVI